MQPVVTCNPGSGLAAHQHAKGTCFAAPKIGVNGARDFPYLSGPSYTNSDLEISKTTHITEGQTVMIKAAASNWLNHPLATFGSSNQLALPFNVDYSSKVATFAPASSDYGVTDSKAGGNVRRIIELSVKYAF